MNDAVAVSSNADKDAALVLMAGQLVAAWGDYRALLQDPVIPAEASAFTQTESRITELSAGLASSSATSLLGLAAKMAVITELLLADPDTALLDDEIALVHSVRDDIRRLAPAAMPSAGIART